MATSPATFLHIDDFIQRSQTLRAHSVHFLTRSLFFFPLSISLILHATADFPSAVEFAAVSPKSILLLPLYTVLVIFPAISGVSAITHSALHGKPIKISSSIKSFIPLLATFIAGLIVLTFISILFAASFHAVKSIGILPYDLLLWGFVGLWTIALFAVITRWGLVAAVVVAESKWGFEPLRRSEAVAKRMLLMELAVPLFSVVCSAFVGTVLMANSVSWLRNGGWWMVFILLVQTPVVVLHFLMTVVKYVVQNALAYAEYNPIAGGDKVVETTNGGGGCFDFEHMYHLASYTWISLVFIHGLVAVWLNLCKA